MMLADSTMFAGMEMPTLLEVWQVFTLQAYNTWIVVVSTSVLGMAAGIVGVFLLLRKRALMGDALSHATLPGICLAFIVMVAAGGSGKFLPGLLAGAAAFGFLGVGTVILIRRFTRLKDDAAMGIVLSVFFGIGAALIGMIQNMQSASAAGLESFIYGKPASIVMVDFWLIIAVTACASVMCLALYKEFRLLCFDDGFAASQGWPTRMLDLTLMGMVTAVTVIGLQSVGLILIIAMLIIPAAAARFWTEKLLSMVILAALIGAASGWIGATFSALFANMPAGAVIVLAGAAVFGFSMVFGVERGVLRRALAHRRLIRRVRRQHLLRTFFEILEPAATGSSDEIDVIDVAASLAGRPVTTDALMQRRVWTDRELRKAIREARRDGEIEPRASAWVLTRAGAVDAVRVVRNHRLWEIYLIEYADVAPSQVDRDADRIEHVLEPALIAQLEQHLEARLRTAVVPASPHHP